MSREKDAIEGLLGEPERDDFAIDADAVARAESIVASLSEEYLEWLEADLQQLDGQLNEARASVRAVDQLRRKAHDIRGQGGSFGFPLISEIADGLHRVMISQEGVLSGTGEDLARGLCAALRVVIERRARGEGDAVARGAVDTALGRVAGAYGDA